MRTLVTTYHLAITDPTQLRPARTPANPCTIVQAAQPTPEFSRFFYTAVGGHWYWTMRLPWTYAEWQAFVSRPGYELWYGVHRGSPIGYFELLRHPDESIEIASFGLLLHYVGQGFGGQLLTAAIARAWSLAPACVTVHTCTLDGPHALANYQARGFQLVRQEAGEQELPDTPPGPWPEARMY
ncbi:MAG: GNAT family N-acetyltransferase [Caldilineaceae bacterium]|nr:GNAT family N-acetyltransferase [Caldilineaceae bacterium]